MRTYLKNTKAVIRFLTISFQIRQHVYVAKYESEELIYARWKRSRVSNINFSAEVCFPRNFIHWPQKRRTLRAQ